MPQPRKMHNSALVLPLLSFQDVGFSKEYEELRADNCLDEYTAQDSQNPENRDKNRYPNIVACESYSYDEQTRQLRANVYVPQ